MKRLLVSLVLFVFASSVGAAELGKRGKKEYMGACGEQDAGLIYAMTNGSNAASCDAAQAVGALRIYCSCTPDGVGGYAWGLLDTALGGEAVDLSGYVLLAGDVTGQTVQGRLGVNQARIDVGEEDEHGITLMSDGAAPSTVAVNDNGVNLLEGTGDGSISIRSAYTQVVSNSGYLHLYGAIVRVESGQTPPTNANDACVIGDTIDTATFHYYCAATDTWVRVAMATW